MQLKLRPKCRYCGKENLRWKQIGERWVLFEKKSLHRCEKMPISLDILKKLAGLK